MNKKTIRLEVLERLVDRAIYNEAREENIEFGNALKRIKEKELENILNAGRKKRKFNKILWERIGWSAAVAALIAVAITIPISVENQSKDKICNIVYSYNAAQLSDLTTMISRSSGEAIIDVTILNDEQLKTVLPNLEESFNNSKSLQDVSINGRVLAFAYIRLHKRKEACKTLEIMIEKLSGDEDYLSSVEEYKEILEQIK